MKRVTVIEIIEGYDTGDFDGTFYGTVQDEAGEMFDYDLTAAFYNAISNPDGDELVHGDIIEVDEADLR